MAINDPTDTNLYPVPSASGYVLKRNAEDLDSLMNAQQNTVTNRYGNVLQTAYQLNNFNDSASVSAAQALIYAQNAAASANYQGVFIPSTSTANTGEMWEYPEGGDFWLARTDSVTSTPAIGNGDWRLMPYGVARDIREFGVLGDGSDEATTIQYAFDNCRNLIIDDTINTSAKITMQENSIVSGRGQLKQYTGSTPAALLETSDDCFVIGITILGNLAVPITDSDVDSGALVTMSNYAEAVAINDLGSTSGILNSGRRCYIDNVKFYQVGKYAIELTTNTGASNQPLRANVTNCLFHNNYIAAYCPASSEYQSFVGCIGKFNYYGPVVIGGNNSFNGCKFDNNRINYMFLSGFNDAHGEVIGGSANHGHLGAFIFDQLSNGQIVNGVSIFEGDAEVGITINESRGVQIKNCIISQNSIYNNGHYDEAGNPGVNIISNNLMGLMGSTYLVTETDSNGPSNLKMFDNYMLEGDDSTTWDYNEFLNNLKYDNDLYRSVSSTSSAKIVTLPECIEYYIGGSSTTGAVRIQLPPIYVDTIISIDVDIIGLGGKTRSYSISGYYTGAGAWSSPDVSGPIYENQIEVNFGKETGGNLLVYLGNTSSPWQYETIIVKKLSLSKNQFTIPRLVKYGWEIAIESSALENVSDTVYSRVLVEESSSLDLETVTRTVTMWCIGPVNGPTSNAGSLISVFRPSDPSFGTHMYTDVTGASWSRGYSGGVWEVSWTAL